MELYDPVTETSTRLPGACPGGFRHDVVGQAVDDGRVLLTCGESARLFDPSAEAFRRLPAEWPSDWGIPVAGQVILATGGTGMVVIVDPKTHQVSVSDPFGGDGPAAEALAPSSVMQTAVRLHDGRVLIVGRSAHEVWRGMATILDPVTGEVTRLQPLGARWSPVVTELLDGRILITGHPSGSPDHYEPRPPAAEILDPSRVP
jgi:RNA polymerase subunit RPABC4/transcription elongation factor Spt4